MEYKFKKERIDNAVKCLSLCADMAEKSGKNYKDCTYWVIYPDLSVKYDDEWKEKNLFWWEVHIFDKNKIEEALIRTLKKNEFFVRARLEYYTYPCGIEKYKKYFDFTDGQLKILKKKSKKAKRDSEKELFKMKIKNFFHKLI